MSKKLSSLLDEDDDDDEDEFCTRAKNGENGERKKVCVVKAFTTDVTFQSQFSRFSVASNVSQRPKKSEFHSSEM